MSKNYEETREFPIATDELLVYVGLTFQAMSAPIYENKPGVGIISATLKFVRHEVEIIPLSSETSKMNISAYTLNVLGMRAPIQSVNAKTVRKQVDEFWQTLDNVIRRAQIQYG